MKLKLLYILLSINSVCLLAQTDSSSILLMEVPVKSTLEKFTSETNVQTVDAATMTLKTTNSLADLLSQNTNVLIKSYGVSGLSTVSLRGGNANHTAVLWNGFNLQDPLNGAFNFALAPVSLVDNVSIKYGGSSAVYGGGALSGTIHLDNLPQFGSKFTSSFNYHLGSFGKQQILAKVGYGTKKWYTALKIFKNKTDNDFSFKNVGKAGFPIDTLENASMKQTGFLFENYYKFSNYQAISTQFWFQDNYREIPPNMISSGGGDALQKDKWYRLALNWHKKSEHFDWQARTGFFYSYLNYVKEDIALNATHKSFNNISELLLDYKAIKKSVISLGFNNNFTVAESDNFSYKPQLNKAALFVSLKSKLLKNTILSINSRSELVDKELKPITFGFFAKYDFTKWFSVQTNLSKNHRNPNFNDLYWSGAWADGNPDLLDENGYTADMSLAFDYKKEYFGLVANLSVYHNNIKQMIQWIPIENFWMPVNQKRVQSNGVELMTDTKISLSDNTKVKLLLNYVYTSALNKEISENESLDILNKQLMYTPKHKLNTLISYNYKTIGVQTNIAFTGKQFTRTDNKSELDAYWLVDLSATYAFNVRKNKFNLFAKANNILNTEYMVREWYPMPPVNFELGVSAMIN